MTPQKRTRLQHMQRLLDAGHVVIPTSHEIPRIVGEAFACVLGEMAQPYLDGDGRWLQRLIDGAIGNLRAEMRAIDTWANEGGQ